LSLRSHMSSLLVVYLVVVRLAVGDRARAFKAFSPVMLPPLGVIFGLLVGFVAVQVWTDFDKAKVAVATEASALRAAVLLAESQLRALINRHIDEAVNREWPSMAHEHLTIASLSTHLVEALRLTISLKPQDESQRTAQREIVTALRTALNARRQRIIISQSEVGPVKWAVILLMGLCTLIAIAVVHSDNRLACAMAVTLFATGIALSSLLIASYSRPFTGEISVRPELLQQVIPSETATTQPNGR
jgi:positive regulator of sigma E activity